MVAPPRSSCTVLEAEGDKCGHTGGAGAALRLPGSHKSLCYYHPRACHLVPQPWCHLCPQTEATWENGVAHLHSAIYSIIIIIISGPVVVSSSSSSSSSHPPPKKVRAAYEASPFPPNSNLVSIPQEFRPSTSHLLTLSVSDFLFF